MPTYLTPGVYIEEISSGSKPIESSPTSVAAFIGVAERGPVNTPVSITKTDEFKAAFGGYLSPGSGAEASYLAHAVSQFFAHGGSRCYVIRVASTGASSASSHTTAIPPLLKDVKAAYCGKENPGAWANTKYEVCVSQSKSDPKIKFDLRVRHKGADSKYTTVEFYPDLSRFPEDRNYAPRIVNAESKLVSLAIATDASDATAEHNIVDDVQTGIGQVYTFVGGDNGDAVKPNADTLFKNALHSLNTIKDVRLIAIPGVPDQAKTGVEYCDNRPEKDCIFFMDPPASANNTNDIIDWAEDTAKGATPSSYAVLYYPWVKASNSAAGGGTELFPPSGFVMGMCGRIDQKRGVWKAPAGLETGMAGVLGVKHNMVDEEQGQLNPRGINCLRIVPGTGAVIWGARTRATRADPEWRYLPVRRTAIMIERSIYDGIQWAVFEPNDHRLWSALRANIESFMNGLFRAGAFQGETSSQAYFVRCGLGDTMTQGDIDRGQVIVQVGFAPLKPAEFVIVRIQQIVGQE